MSITAEVVAYGRSAEALAALHPHEIGPRGRTRCWDTSHHKHADRTPSATASPEKGCLYCHVLGTSIDLVDLALLHGLATDVAGVRREFECRGWLPPRNGNGAPRTRSTPPSTSSRGQPEFPYYPATAARLGWELRSGVLYAPVVDAGGDQCATKRRGQRGDSGLDCLLLPAPSGRKAVGLIVGSGWPEALEREDALVLLLAGETDQLALEHHAAAQGIPVVTATHSSGEGARLGALVEAFRAQRVSVIYDLDEPGRQGAARIVSELRAAGIVAADVLLPIDATARRAGAKDVREFLSGNGTVRELLAVAEAALDGVTPGDRNVSTVETRPTVPVTTDLSAVADQAVAVLDGDPDRRIYQRAGLLVRVAAAHSESPTGGVSRSVGAPVIARAPRAWIREELSRAARWERSKADGGSSAVAPPVWVAETIEARDRWPFPELAGVIEAPTMRADGTILDAPGFDDETGLLLRPSGEFPPVPAAPTSAQVRAAVELVLAPWGDFPFVAESDRAAAIAAMLTATARAAVPGPAPLFAWRATAPGSGKSLGADVQSIIATGRPAARMVAVRDDAEMRKRILAIGLQGAGVVLLDNVDGSLGSPALAAALTGTTFTDRLLGASQVVTVPLTGLTWLATGNALVFNGDLGRRVVPIDLDAQLEHPEDRADFAHPDLLAWVRSQREALVVAGLTILRAYHVAGRPRHGGARIGSFELWDDLIRGATVWCDIGDPAAGRDRVRKEGDQDLDVLRAAAGAWWERYGSAAVKLAEVARHAESDAVLRDGLAGLTRRGVVDARSLGYALRRVSGRIVSGRRFETGKTVKGTRTWRVAEVRS